MKRALVILTALFSMAAPAAAQGRLSPDAGESLPAALEAIQHARVRTRVLFITAHPDDESSSLLTYLSRGLGADTALLTLTRGEGGQNVIGPEQGPELGLLRTEELSEATQIYGVKLFFSSAPDFGYSKSAEETLKIWDGRVLADIVQVIRTFRPEVVINGWGGVHGGHGQHQASGILVPQAFDAAGDAAKFPEQLHDGITAWRATILAEFWRGGFASPNASGPPAGAWQIPADQVSPLWGMSYIEIGSEGTLRHRSQSLSAFIDSPFFRRPLYLIAVKGGPVDTAALSESFSAYAARTPALQPFAEGIRSVEEKLDGASKDEELLRWPEAATELADAAALVELAEQGLEKNPGGGEALWEVQRLRKRIDRALALALGIRITARADRSDLVGGEDFTVRISTGYRPAAQMELSPPELVLPSGWTATKPEAEATAGVRIQVSIPEGAVPPADPLAWMRPWPAPLVRARVRFRVRGYDLEIEQPVIARHATSTAVVDLPLELVPEVTLNVEPRQIVKRSDSAGAPMELRARVRYYGTLAAHVTLGLDAPAGWSVETPGAIDFTGAGDALARFVVRPPAGTARGAYALKPYARIGSQEFRTTRETLPSLPSRTWSFPAEAAVHVLDLRVPEHLRVGYVAGDNDTIPEYLRQLGIEVDLLDEAELAFGDLSRFDAIALGIRAYELRDDAVRANPRLLAYVERGGTLVVQYERDFFWQRQKLAPYPGEMNPAKRITDENSPVRFVEPASPLLNFPNRITAADFDGWVQERGLYFWNKFDPRYQAVLAMRDPGEEEELGGLVTTHLGKGTYIYTGLAFFRQLPAGVPGAYRLFVNLLSQSRASR